MSLQLGSETTSPALPAPTLQWWPRLRPREVHNIKLPLHGCFSIGRHLGCDLSLEDETASRAHAELQVVAGRVRLVDAGSRNGTYVNRARVSTDVWLRHGDQVRIADTCLTVHYPTLDGQPTPRANEVERPTVVATPWDDVVDELLRLDDEYNGQLVRLKKGEVEKLLVKRLGGSRRGVQRDLAALAQHLDVEGAGSELVRRIVDQLKAKSRSG